MTICDAEYKPFNPDEEIKEISEIVDIKLNIEDLVAVKKKVAKSKLKIKN